MSRASNIVDRISLGRQQSIGCRRWRPICFSVRWLVVASGSSVPLAAKAATTTDTDHFHRRGLSGRNRSRCEPRPPGGQHHRDRIAHRRARRETDGLLRELVPAAT